MRINLNAWDQTTVTSDCSTRVGYFSVMVKKRVGPTTTNLFYVQDGLHKNIDIFLKSTSSMI